jgi:predicted DCC family thiol-disulfide oxidoreductase YuxK
MDASDEPVVLFDGVCNLCNGSIQFILDHERDDRTRLRFAALQSEAARGLLERAFGPEQAQRLREGATGSGAPETLVLIEGERGSTRSTALLRISRHLRAPWRWAVVLLALPRPVRDAAYRLVARNRYRWFGRTDTCRVPTPELRARFLA